MQNNPVMRQDPTGMLDTGPGEPGGDDTDICGLSTEDYNLLEEITIVLEKDPTHTMSEGETLYGLANRT